MDTDSWAIRAKKLGLRSRAVFKLEEILIRTKALNSKGLVLDIGSAPGGWTQIVKIIQPKSTVYALDLLPMEPIKDVYFFQEDVANIDAINDISLLKTKFDLVISDLAPNLTGISAVDEENIYELNSITVETAVNYLNRSNGTLILKTFQNSLFKKIRSNMEKNFNIVQTFKPAASKSKSGEIYLYGER